MAKHQKYIASVLGVPANKIVSKTKRLGGGFGGKETRGIFLHTAIAVPSYHLRRPVRIMLDRDEDMQMSGEEGWGGLGSNPRSKYEPMWRSYGSVP